MAKKNSMDMMDCISPAWHPLRRPSILSIVSIRSILSIQPLMQRRGYDGA